MRWIVGAVAFAIVIPLLIGSTRGRRAWWL